MRNPSCNSKNFEWQKYCSYEKFLCIAAYVLRLLPKYREYGTNTGAIVDPAELENAEQLEKGKVLKSTPHNKTCKLAQFSPFIGPNGLLRASGRTKNPNGANFDLKHSIRLDARHYLVRLLFEHTHVQHCHQGVDYLRALIQQRLAVFKLRKTLRTIVSSSVTSCKRKAETVTPVTADLLRERLAFKDPLFQTLV